MEAFILIPVFFIFIIAPFAVLIKFFQFLASEPDERVLTSNYSIALSVIIVFIFPLVFIAALDYPKNDCCGDTAFFSPDHRPSIYLFIFLAMIAYFYSIFTDKVFTPLAEVFVNCFLIIGIVINLLMLYHHEEILTGVFGNLPIALLFIIALAENQIKLIETIERGNLVFQSPFTQFIAKFLTMSPLARYPILVVLCLPLIELFTTILLLFGQKPDSLILAFTQTYNQGFSQLNHLCENVECGEHYLCSVAANGHQKIVKPVRYGIRNNGLIICNRQLLVANAFEELIQEKMPKSHRFIRKQVNIYIYRFSRKETSF